jgi:hypothetical protein
MLNCLLHFIAPKSRSLLLIAVLTLVAPEISRAAAIFDWASNFGPEFNSIPNGSQASSDLPGLTAAIDFGGGGDGLRVDQGSAWNGNFNPGDALLWTNSPGQGPLTFTFNQPVTSVGTNIQGDFFGSFNAQLNVFDGSGNLLGSQTATGFSNSDNDGSAPFLGITNTPGIISATFRLTACPCDTTDFAISSLVVSTAPEPRSFLLVAPLAVFILQCGRRKLIRK